MHEVHHVFVPVCGWSVSPNAGAAQPKMYFGGKKDAFMVVNRDTGEVLDDRYELVDVELYVALGMTPKEARCFARFLDDQCPAGFGSGKLASLIAKRLERAEKSKLNAQTQARAMISKFTDGYNKLPFRD